MSQTPNITGGGSFVLNLKSLRLSNGGGDTVSELGNYTHKYNIDDLKWDKNTNHIKGMQTKNKSHLVKIFKTFIRSRLEYASTLA